MEASSTCSGKVESKERLEDIFTKASPELISRVRPLPAFVIVTPAAHKTD